MELISALRPSFSEVPVGPTHQPTDHYWKLSIHNVEQLFLIGLRAPKEPNPIYKSRNLQVCAPQPHLHTKPHPLAHSLQN